MAGWQRGWPLPASVPIGLQLYSVGAELKQDVPGTLRRVREIGYTMVETAGIAGLTGKEFRAQLDRAGLVCHSAHMQLKSSKSELSESEVGPLFDEAHAIGAHYVVCSGIFAANAVSGAETLDDFKVLADRVNALALKAKKAGLQYAYHNHNFEFRKVEGGRVGYDVLLERTEKGLVDMELDCGWVVVAGYDPADYFRRYPGRYKMLHIKDFVSGTGPTIARSSAERPKGTELGRGHIDYRPILRAAKEAGIHDYYVEQEPPFLEMKALDAVKVDYEYLRAL